MFSHINCFLVLLLGFLFLFDHPFNYLGAKLSSKSVNASIGIHWKVVLEFYELFSNIFVFLSDGDIGYSVDDLNLKARLQNWQDNMFIIVELFNFLVDSVTATLKFKV